MRKGERERKTERESERSGRKEWCERGRDCKGGWWGRKCVIIVAWRLTHFSYISTIGGHWWNQGGEKLRDFSMERNYFNYSWKKKNHVWHLFPFWINNFSIFFLFETSQDLNLLHLLSVNVSQIFLRNQLLPEMTKKLIIFQFWSMYRGFGQKYH